MARCIFWWQYWLRWIWGVNSNTDLLPSGCGACGVGTGICGFSPIYWKQQIWRRGGIGVGSGCMDSLPSKIRCLANGTCIRIGICGFGPRYWQRGYRWRGGFRGGDGCAYSLPSACGAFGVGINVCRFGLKVLAMPNLAGVDLVPFLSAAFFAMIEDFRASVDLVSSYVVLLQ